MWVFASISGSLIKELSSHTEQLNQVHAELDQLFLEQDELVSVA